MKDHPHPRAMTGKSRHRDRSVATHDSGLHGLPCRYAFHEQRQPCLSLRAPTRNPWLEWHCIPDQVRAVTFRFKLRVRDPAGMRETRDGESVRNNR